METFLTHLCELKLELGEHALFSVGVLLVVGYFIGKLAEKLHLPEITGFIVAGLLLGKSALGIIPLHMNESLSTLTEVALGLIAVTIGGEFYWVKLKRMGKDVVIITIMQIALTFLAVMAGLLVFRMELPYALLLGAIATATAPAATVAIVQSLRAHGVFIDYLYGVVALDDAGCVVLFGVVFAIVSGMLSHAGGAVHIVLHAVLDVVFSIALGIVAGLLIHFMTRRKQNTNELLIVSLGMILLTTAIAVVFDLSPLLTNMAVGTVIINMSARNHRIFRALEPMTPPVYALFFVIAGTELRPEIIATGSILLWGGVYILLRALGKYGGVWLGCLLSGTEPRIRRYLGFSMLPQAGVAIGLVLLIQASPILAELSQAQQYMIDTMVNIILFSVFINELIGPVFSRYAIVRGNQMEV
ncbi:MAG: cation:proton antiporter [Candidatus Cloacimonetes bacterium]|nr:cation:proton antiporter [Candidatus Cloacimonadota bacterium]